MKCLLFAVLAWCGAVCAPAEEYAFPGEREWISKFGDVVKGSFHSCTGAGAVLKIGRRHVEIPLTRLDEEDAALAASDGSGGAPEPETGRDALAFPDEGTAEGDVDAGRKEYLAPVS